MLNARTVAIVINLFLITLQNVHSSRVCHASARTWDRRTIPIVDTSLCQGRGNLAPAPKVDNPRHRISQSGNNTYWELYHSNAMEGWVHPHQPNIIRSITQKQWELGILGAVGEIGVHHGKFLIPIVGHADAAEPAVAIDLFEQHQLDNFDGSGRGSSLAMCQNMEKVGMACNDVTVWSTNSLHINASSFAEKQLPEFRMFSVDGGHSLDVTLHDMMLASCILKDGGVIAVDDHLNEGWLGVVEAVILFINHQSRVVPFLNSKDKIYLTTRKFHDVYLQHVKSDPSVGCVSSHASRRALGGWEVCSLS